MCTLMQVGGVARDVQYTQCIAQYTQCVAITYLPVAQAPVGYSLVKITGYAGGGYAD